MSIGASIIFLIRVECEWHFGKFPIISDNILGWYWLHCKDLRLVTQVFENRQETKFCKIFNKLQRISHLWWRCSKSSTTSAKPSTLETRIEHVNTTKDVPFNMAEAINIPSACNKAHYPTFSTVQSESERSSCNYIYKTCTV